MNNLPQLPRIFIGNWGAACYSSSWFYPAAHSSSGGWMPVADDTILWLTRVPAAGYELQLSRLLAVKSSSSGWIQLTADSSSGGWIRVAADSILRMTRAPAPGSDLSLIPSWGWLWVVADSSSGGCLRVTAIREHKGQNSARTGCRGLLVLESWCRGFLVLESRCCGFLSSEKTSWNDDFMAYLSPFLDVVVF